MYRKYELIAVVFFSVFTTVASPAAAEMPLDIGGRRELFVDRKLIDELSNGARLQLHEPVSAGQAIAFDKPWEGIYCSYVTVLHDGAKYLMYYRGNPGEEADGNPLEVTCYAESNDGMKWTKPSLGLFNVMGSKDNNVVLSGDAPFSHNFSPFIDTRPGVPPDQKYKAIAGINSASGLVAFQSANGIHWSKIRAEPIFTATGQVFDSQNVVFWSESESCYVLFYRTFVNKIRSIAKTTSPDFINWQPGTVMSYSSDAPTVAAQFYANQTTPYFRAPHIYLSLAARFMQSRASLTKQEQVRLGIAADHWMGWDCADTVLLTSRGKFEFDRQFPQALVRPGAELANWASRNNYAAQGIVQTSPTEMSIFVQRHTGFPTHYLERLTFRLDGLASISSDHRLGEIVTKPFVFAGNQLELNFRTSAAGVVCVEVQTADGTPVEGYSMSDCTEIFGDAIARTVQWKGDRSLSQLAGKPIRLRIQLREADLFSIRFVP